MIPKTEIRKKCFEKRKNLGQDYINSQSEIIINKILSTEEYKNAKCIFTYISTPGEVCTDMLIKKSITDSKITLVPVLISKTEMAAGSISIDTVFIKNRYNIDEPEIKNFYDGKIDIIITPGLSFCSSGERLGYGGGFFDRFFVKHKEALKIGLCLDELIAQNLPCESHDIKMDMIITQSR
ncbi:MAG: 5-formyltetrahydrofolate cyclo-ligase, partial [Eubacteriaceae bacterium]|nr:5-formyltetrahydrofolate cyclo-ligase [Eubacteriaceae bacterium]